MMDSYPQTALNMMLFGKNIVAHVIRYNEEIRVDLTQYECILVKGDNMDTHIHTRRNKKHHMKIKIDIKMVFL